GFSGRVSHSAGGPVVWVAPLGPRAAGAGDLLPIARGASAVGGAGGEDCTCQPGDGCATITASPAHSGRSHPPGGARTSLGPSFRRKAQRTRGMSAYVVEHTPSQRRRGGRRLPGHSHLPGIERPTGEDRPSEA